MSTYVGARFAAHHTCKFPALDPATPTVLVTISGDGKSYEVDTNIGMGMTAKDATFAVGYALHLLSDALIGGERVDLSDLDEAIPTTSGDTN